MAQVPVTTDERVTALAVKIQEMLNLRAQGVLKRSADDFISGLIKAYAILLNVEDVRRAQALALERAHRATPAHVTRS